MVKNWCGNLNFHPKKIFKPSSITELKKIVTTANHFKQEIRPIGNGHSWTKLIATNSLCLSLKHYQGIEAIDLSKNEMSVRAGTTIRTVLKKLGKEGLMLENLGDIDRQTLAGAMSTGTHGSGLNFGVLSTQLRELTLLLASGEIIQCSPQKNPDLFKAAQVSLGMLGMIIGMKIKVQPNVSFKLVLKKEKLTQCLTNLDEYLEKTRHFEFFYFPYTNQVQEKFIDLTDEPHTYHSLKRVNDFLLENFALEVLCKISKSFPRLTKSINHFIANTIGEGTHVGTIRHILPTPRLVKFYEMEYAIPLPSFISVMEEITALINKQNFNVCFPIECRFVKKDDIWLSPAYGRDSAFIAVHMYKQSEYASYFKQIEQIFLKYDGRPHWGKIHHYPAQKLSKTYPRLNQFLKIREQCDPNNIFLNDYLSQLFYPPEPQLNRLRSSEPVMEEKES